MSEHKIKSGKEIIDDFFNIITTIEGVDTAIAKSFAELHTRGNFSDIHVKNELQRIRQNGNHN